jgi:Cdc6-like AAA superfamily ATPase
MKTPLFFNTAGPVNGDKHYCLPPLNRFNLEEILSLIEQEKYFVLHAPRQSGKTSSLKALMEYINREERYHCLYINVEMGQAARENVKEGVQAILTELASRVRTSKWNDTFPQVKRREVLEEWGASAALNQMLTLWAEKSPKPIVLLMDEIDSLVGDTLISVLRQLRAGYDKRPA